MNLLAIGLMIFAALGTWLFHTYRAIALLLISILALYGFQTAGGEIVLPTATLILVVGVWWLVIPEPTADDWRTLALIGCAATILPLISAILVAGKTFQQAAILLPILTVAGIGTASVGFLIPERDDTIRRRLAILFVVFVMVLLFVVKMPFLQVSIASQAGWPVNWQWFGFSYITFRLMHVLLDFRSGRLSAISLRDFALYVIFFPALAAGPIDRIEHFVRELQASSVFDWERFVEGGTRIGIGLFKKFVLADTLAFIALDARLVELSPGTPGYYWLMLYAYAWRIFLDFSGYTDIAIGIGLLAGIRLPENFNQPYLKRNIALFWNNWHITLSTWFRNYFFTPFSRAVMGTPLRSSRTAMMLIAQVSTMVLIGLWHGIALNFVLWGLWHGLGLWLHRLLVERTRSWDHYVTARPQLARIIHVLSVVTTFHFVALGWIFFALSDTRLIIKTLAGLVGLHG
jgi:alginate O-acetyltransferase complex protein AlgI